ncbi:MAG TPA: PPC domain-containing protein, partial [Pirellulales bacterium]
MSVLLSAPSAEAQLPTPQLQSIFPRGARHGTTVECVIGGRELVAADGLYFSHPGILATKIADNRFRVVVAADVPIGRYDVRAVCKAGVSSCRSFIIGDRPETIETEPNNAPGEAQPVTLPRAIEGQISGGIDVDEYAFHARKGQRVFINCWAWRIDSQLDATLMLYDAAGKELIYSGDYYGKDPFLDFTAPADGEYTVKIWDFVYGGGPTNVYRLEIDSLPHLDAILPAAVHAGEPTHVVIYGRNLPGGKPVPGVAVVDHPLEMVDRTIQLGGGNGGRGIEQAYSLHAAEAVRPPQTSIDGSEYRLVTEDGASNSLFVAFTRDPIVLEHELNDSLAQAQPLAVPCDVSGSFSPEGDKDFYAFQAAKGQKVVVEVFGERQSGLVDPILSGFDAHGKRLTTADDNGRNIGQLRFTTTSRDGRWDFTAPADGQYFVQVRDLYFQQRGEPRFTYRLSVRPPRPDFRLLAVPVAEVQPDATTVRRGGNHWLDVLAFRDDGFDAPITVTADSLPPGVSCQPVVIGPGKSSVPLVFHAAKDAPLGYREIGITGRAGLPAEPSGKAGGELVRRARGGSLIWETVNTPGIARLADTIVLAVREPPPFVVQAKPAAATMSAGGRLAIDVTISRAADWNEAVQLSGFDLPGGATLPLKQIAKGATSGRVELILAPNANPGTFTFTLQGSG